VSAARQGRRRRGPGTDTGAAREQRSRPGAWPGSQRSPQRRQEAWCQSCAVCPACSVPCQAHKVSRVPRRPPCAPACARLLCAARRAPPERPAAAAAAMASVPAADLRAAWPRPGRGPTLTLPRPPPRAAAAGGAAGGAVRRLARAQRPPRRRGLPAAAGRAGRGRGAVGRSRRRRRRARRARARAGRRARAAGCARGAGRALRGRRARAGGGAAPGAHRRPRACVTQRRLGRRACCCAVQGCTAAHMPREPRVTRLQTSVVLIGCAITCARWPAAESRPVGRAVLACLGTCVSERSLWSPAPEHAATWMQGKLPLGRPWGGRGVPEPARARARR
jgi:hypothetical protein